MGSGVGKADSFSTRIFPQVIAVMTGLDTELVVWGVMPLAPLLIYPLMVAQQLLLVVIRNVGYILG